jgi:hypothetical protein
VDIVVGGDHLGRLFADHDRAALVLPLVTFGITLASATRRPPDHWLRNNPTAA